MVYSDFRYCPAELLRRHLDSLRLESYALRLSGLNLWMTLHVYVTLHIKSLIDVF